MNHGRLQYAMVFFAPSFDTVQCRMCVPGWRDVTAPTGLPDHSISLRPVSAIDLVGVIVWERRDDGHFKQRFLILM